MIKATNHIGISVTNLDRSVDFYRRGFGMEIVSQGVFESEHYEKRYGQILGLPDAAGKVALLKADGFQVE